MSALEIFKNEKQNSIRDSLVLPFETEDKQPAQLRFIGHEELDNENSIKLMARWRDENSMWFPAQFKVTFEGTRTWFKKGVLDTPDRILFWVIDADEKKIGHVGLFRYIPSGQQIEIDNILRGERPKNKRIIKSAIVRMLQWQREVAKIPNSYLRVLSDNDRAINLYKELKYFEIQRVALKKEVLSDRVQWVEIHDEPYIETNRYFVTMKQAI